MKSYTRGLNLSALTILCVALTGCGDGLKGTTYLEDGSKDGIEFKSGNKADITIMGQTVEADYAIDGDKINLNTHGAMGTIVVTHGSDGTITGLPGCGPLKKSS